MIMSQTPPLDHTQIRYKDSRGQSLITDEHIALSLSHITWQASSSQPRTPNNGGVGNLEDTVSILIL